LASKEKQRIAANLGAGDGDGDGDGDLEMKRVTLV
jgi:hypothetical protein